jgi:hypothetical protein
VCACAPEFSATGACKAHGGGKRCQQAGCLTAAQGGKQHCHAHGGGRRCQEEGCTKSARGDTQSCIAHGGGRRCQEEGCLKSAEGDTGACKAHGGGKRCQQAGCLTPLKAASSTVTHTVAAGGASTWAARRELLVVARPTASRTVGASGSEGGLL